MNSTYTNLYIVSGLVKYIVLLSTVDKLTPLAVKSEVALRRSRYEYRFAH